MKPRRIQLSRRKGWRKPPLTVVVSRPSRWGNPYLVSSEPPGTILDDRQGTIAVASRADAVAAYREWLIGTEEGEAILSLAKRKLQGLNLACWCPLDQPCHAEVLLELVQ